MKAITGDEVAYNASANSEKMNDVYPTTQTSRLIGQLA